MVPDGGSYTCRVVNGYGHVTIATTLRVVAKDGELGGWVDGLVGGLVSGWVGEWVVRWMGGRVGV